MLQKLYPDLYIESIFHLPIDLLKKKKIKGLVFDIDNTLAPYDVQEPSPMVIEALKRLLDEGFRICLLSNNTKKRVGEFNKKLGLRYVCWGVKPLKPGINKAMALIGTKTSNTAIIGDQIFTDVWCGRRIGVFSILVKPMVDRDQIFTKVKRGIEKKIIKSYIKHRKIGG